MVALNFRMLTAKEVASVLAVSEKTVYRLAAKGIIPSFREGRVVRFIPDDIEQFQQRREDRHGVDNPQTRSEETPGCVPGAR